MRLYLKILFLIIFLPFSSLAGNLYSIENIEISSSAINASKAREEAIDSGYLKAFSILINELEVQNFDVNIEQVKSLVRDFELSNEVIASGKYMAKINVSFSKKHVDDFLLKKGLLDLHLKKISKYSYKKTQNTTHVNVINNQKKLILPLIKKDDGAIIWDSESYWYMVWKEKLNQTKNHNYVLPNDNYQDHAFIDFLNLDGSNFDDFKSILLRYDADEVILLIANKVLNNNAEDLVIEVKLLNSKISSGSFERILSLNGDNSENLYNQAIELALKNKFQFNDDNQFGKAVNPLISENFASVIYIDNIEDWVNIESNLKNIDYLDYKLKKLSLKKIELDFSIKKDLNYLFEDLSKFGLKVTKEEGQIIVIRN